MKLKKATLDDNHKLSSYFSKTMLPGPLDMRFERKKNFFSQYQIQSDDYLTYYLENDENEIEAMVSLIFREGFIDDKQQIIGYATDLRVSKSRKAILQWAQNFLPALERERDSRNCKYIFSVVANEQREAYNAFIRPRSPKRKMPRYYSFRQFQIVSVHGLVPFVHKPLPGIKISEAGLQDADQLYEYILAKKRELSFYFINDKDALEESLSRWGFKLNDFLIAKDIENNIIGCTAPWSSSKTQTIYPQSYSPKAKSLQESLQLLSYLGVTHPFANENTPLKFKYLTHLHSNNPDIFFSLVYYAFKQLPKQEFLAYAHFEGDLLTLLPKSFITGSSKCGLYCILAPNESLPDFLKPSYLNTPPDFELAFV